ncbi:MAG: hypothetical protein PHF79_01085 [Candidatus Pacebacteria bacterium]|nr:hypothetical protein [Candidatus Paceibacterota bacterium]
MPKEDTILEAILDLRVYVENKFDQVDKRFDRIEKRLEAIESRVESIEENIASIKVDMSIMKDDIHSNRQKTIKLEQSLEHYVSLTASEFAKLGA